VTVAGEVAAVVLTVTDAVTVTVADVVVVRPFASTTVKVTAYVPGSTYEWLTEAPFAVVPSPNSQL